MELAEEAVDAALRLGATEAEAYLRRARTVQVEFVDEVENFRTARSSGIGLRVALGGRVSLYSTSILEEDEARDAAARAVALARVAPEDPRWNRMNTRFGEAPAEGYRDGDVEGMDYGEVVERVLAAVTAMRGHDRRVRPARGILTLVSSRTAVANSCGEGCEREETHVAAWMRAKVEEAGRESTGTDHAEIRSWGEVDLERLALGAAERAVASLGARPIPSLEAPVIFRNQVFAGILGAMLAGPLSADWVQKGRSPLESRLGAEIASEDVSVVDDGLMRGGWRTRPFDDEGHPTRKTQVIDGGRLRSFLYDTYTALQDGVESTGNARRPGYWAAPQPSPSNLVLRPGSSSVDEMIAETGRGVYVEETIGEWLSNPVSGELSATVTHGFLIERGRLAEPIQGMVVSGNFYEVLRGGLELIGDDQRNSANDYSPTVKVSGLTLAGR